MALTEIQLRNLISFNVPDNIQGLVTPFKIREVMNEMVTKAFDSQLDNLVADNPLSFNAATKTLSMPRATAGQSGYLHAFDFAVFNTVAGDYVSQQGEYHNPSWLMELSWNKIINTPATLAGYGITDPVVLTSGNYTDPSWIASLAYSKLTGAPVLGTVAAINTNGNGNTYLAGDGAWKTIDLSGYVTLSGTQTISGAKTFSSVINATGGIGTSGAANVDFFANNALVGRIFQGTGRWSIGYASPVDSGFLLDLNGTLRTQQKATFGNSAFPAAGNAASMLVELISGGHTASITANSGRYDVAGNFSFLGESHLSSPRLAGVNNSGNDVRLLVTRSGTGPNRFINVFSERYANWGAGESPYIRFSSKRYEFWSDFEGISWNSYFVRRLLSLNENGQLLLAYDTGATAHNSSAAFQIVSTTRGFAPPQMTSAERLLIANPLSGLILYDTTLNHLCFYNGTAWQKISHSPA